MKKIEYGTSEYVAAFNILSAYGTEGSDEVQVAWGLVESGKKAQPHQHSEKEIYVIISGQGVANTRDEEFPVKSGDVILIDPLEIHYLTNDNAENLLFADLYWQPKTSEIRDNSSKAKNPNAPIFVFSPPPTPNGDLHLGHLSGPYLGADVYKRFERMRGRRVFHLTGSDDYQSYVRSLAKKTGVTEFEIASQYSLAVRKTLDLFDVEYDYYLCTSTDEPYSTYMQKCFKDLTGNLEFTSAPALLDSNTNEYLYEVDVRGECPACGSNGNGNICEQCGEPNLCVDLKNSISNISNTATSLAQADRFMLPLHKYYDVIRAHLDQSKVSPRVRVLAENILKREPFNLPLSHPEKWGVKVDEKDHSDQSIWVWVNMFYGFMYGLEALGIKLGEDWSQPDNDWHIVQFFGFDNSFYYTVLYPVLFKLSYPSWNVTVDYNYNEFYLLENEKFSTSRRHAIWGKEILNPDTVDIIRYFLSKTRSEYKQTNFDLSNLLNEAEATLISKWEKWVVELQRKVGEKFSGVTPSTGLWMPEYSSYIKSLEYKQKEIAVYYSSQSFSLTSVIKIIDSMVDDVISFSGYNDSLRENQSLYSYYRTAVALEITTLKSLAEMIYPIMPRYSKHLLSLLGISDDPKWPESVTLLDGGIKMNVERGDFFSAGHAFISDYKAGRS